MSKFFIVPESEYRILKKYLGASNALVLVPETALAEFPENEANTCRQLNGTDVDYDFGGEPDITVDLLLCKESYAHMLIEGPMSKIERCKDCIALVETDECAYFCDEYKKPCEQVDTCSEWERDPSVTAHEN